MLLKRLSKAQFLLFLIFFAALFLRVYKLSTVPAGFHQDEAANAYMGKFILVNGKDFYGNPWPVFYFDKWGDYPPVLPMYFTGLGSLLFGDNVFGARIIIAFFGALSVIPLYFLALSWFKDKFIALFSSFLLAILPWHIVFSRSAAEGVLSLFFLITALAFYFAGKKQRLFRILAFFNFLLSFLSYPSFRLIVPAVYFVILVLEKVERKKIRNFTLISFIFFITLTFWISTTDWGRARFQQTSIFNEIKSKEEYNNQFIYDEKSVFLARLFHNKGVILLQEFLKQYLSYFSPLYLLLGEGANPAWYRFPNSGLVYFSMAISFFGLFLVFYKKVKHSFKREGFVLVFFLLFLTPVPAALTIEHAIHMHRSIGMVLPVVLLSGFGVYFILKALPKVFSFVLLILLVVEFVNFYHNYFSHVSAYSSLHRSEANQYTALYLKENKDKYKDVYMFVTGWFPVYYLYHTSNYSPELIGKIKKMYFPKIDNISFIPKNCPDQEDLDKAKKGSLVVFSAICDPGVYRGVKKISSVKNTSGLDIFNIFVKN